MKLWAIGDIHGSASELETLLEIIKPSAESQLVFLGDLVGRGPDSKRVMDLVIDLFKRQYAYAVIGNHDKHFIDMCVSILNDLPVTAHLKGWDILWGRHIIKSFSMSTYEKSLLSPYINFLSLLPNYFMLHDFYFTHKPANANLSMQSFCGHQTVKTIDVTQNPILVDTGAGANGYLSAVECFSKEIVSCK